MSNFERLTEIISGYLKEYDADTDKISSLHQASENSAKGTENSYVYNGKNDLAVIDMDRIASDGYRKAKNVKDSDNTVNTADSFLVDQEDRWYFVEFKDSEVKATNSGMKNNVLKKAYSNWYMMLDILYHMYQKNMKYPAFSYEQPVEYAREHVQYVLVCSKEKNPLAYSKIKDCRLAGGRYTPPLYAEIERLSVFRCLFVYGRGTGAGTGEEVSVLRGEMITNRYRI